MFTGIVQGIATVTAVETRPGLSRIQIALPSGTGDHLTLGASIAIDGVCLTVAAFSANLVTFDVMQETLHRTSLASIQKGSIVNVERSASAYSEIGGHPISGHIDTTAKIEKISQPENNYVIRIALAEPWAKYIFNKGFVGLNGASLTVTNLDRQNAFFEAWLIPETLRLTTFGSKKVGDLVNLEVDRNTQVIVDTVTRFLEARFDTQLSGSNRSSLFE
jgi:riboflavin synthase